MSEKRFLNCILVEGIALTILGLCILILPKLTELSFGVMLSCAFIAYGIYKSVNGIMSRNFCKNYIWQIVLGIYLFALGVLLLCVPKVNLLWLIALIGVYFLAESVSTSAFMSQIRTKYNFWGCKFLSALILFFIGILIVLGVPAIAFWVVAMFSGLGFLIKGITKITLYNANCDLNEY